MVAPRQPTKTDPSLPPFEEARQLCHKLTQRFDSSTSSYVLEPADPAATQDEAHLPGFPRVPLSSNRDIANCLRAELCTPKLNGLHGYMWLVASQASDHISPLTDQIVRGRQIVITENPELHLVWVHARIFIKPLPEVLLSHATWSVVLTDSTKTDGDDEGDGLRRAALGYMRSYAYLIRHESDFRLARREHLIPEGISYNALSALLSAFDGDRVLDSDVSLRYRYGQLRLTRLNTWARLSLQHATFHKVHWQYADIFAQRYAPLVLVFGFLSIVLAAMQVGAQVRPAWEGFASVAAWFAVSCLFLVVVTGASMGMTLVAMVGNELQFAVRTKLRRR